MQLHFSHNFAPHAKEKQSRSIVQRLNGVVDDCYCSKLLCAVRKKMCERDVFNTSAVQHVDIFSHANHNSIQFSLKTIRKLLFKKCKEIESINPHKSIKSVCCLGSCECERTVLRKYFTKNNQ